LANSTNPFISDVSAEVCCVQCARCLKSLARCFCIGRGFRCGGEHSMESSRRRADRHWLSLVVPGHSCIVARCSSVLLMERNETSHGNGMGVCCTRWIGFECLSLGRSLATETSQSLARTISQRESIARWIRSSLTRRRLPSAESVRHVRSAWEHLGMDSDQVDQAICGRQQQRRLSLSLLDIDMITMKVTLPNDIRSKEVRLPIPVMATQRPTVSR
jgi:hypothetical protein